MTQANQDLFPQAVQTQPVDTPRVRCTEHRLPDRNALFAKLAADEKGRGPRVGFGETGMFTNLAGSRGRWRLNGLQNRGRVFRPWGRDVVLLGEYRRSH